MNTNTNTNTNVYAKYTTAQERDTHFRIVPSRDANLLAYELLSERADIIESLRSTASTNSCIVVNSVSLFEQEVIFIAHNKDDVLTAVESISGFADPSKFSLRFSTVGMTDLPGSKIYLVEMTHPEMTKPAYVVAHCDTDLNTLIMKMLGRV